MLTITRALARRLRVVFTRALGRSRLGLSDVLFRFDRNGVTIGVRGRDTAVEYRHLGTDGASSGSSQPVSFAVPLELLKRCEGTSDTPVALEPQAESVTARWADGSVPQVESFPRHEPFDLPLRPDRMEPNDPRLLSALHDAAECTDSLSTRYALSCLLLSGNGGRIAATDAHQLLVQGGFTFPWTDDVLIPTSAVFASRELHTGEPVQIGRTDEFVTLATGPWTIHLRVEKEARFPRIDSILPNAASAESVMHLSPEDCEFLLNALPKLPGQADDHSPVTCDLNGQVAIRSKGADQPQATELLLTNSRVDGKPILCQTNRNLLSRALRMGFRTVHLFDPKTTVLCQDEQRQFVWMLLGTEGLVPAEANPIRIESPASITATPTSGVVPINRLKRRPRTMPTARSAPQPDQTHVENGRLTANGSSTATRSSVEQLVALRDTLKMAVAQTNDAIRVLKRQRREDRLLKSTLSSLRQLQNIAS